jgi:hypothetical protein
MPTKEEILNGLQTIVNQYQVLAILWHLIFYLLLATIVFIWRPSGRTLALIISLPIISVSVLAWLTGNPFNGSLFTILAILTIIFGLRASNEAINVSQITFIVTGILMIVFGLVYPHFGENDSLLKYLYASPSGLIPCPTLSILIGLLLVFSGLGSQSLTVIFIVFGLFYGLFGVFKLAVYVDLFLVFGSLMLLVRYLISLRA